MSGWQGYGWAREYAGRGNRLRRAVTWPGVLAPYPQLVRAGYRRYATYRQATLAGLTTNVVFGLLRAAVPPEWCASSAGR